MQYTTLCKILFYRITVMVAFINSLESDVKCNRTVSYIKPQYKNKMPEDDFQYITQVVAYFPHYLYLSRHFPAQLMIHNDSSDVSDP